MTRAVKMAKRVSNFFDMFILILNTSLFERSKYTQILQVCKNDDAKFEQNASK